MRISFISILILKANMINTIEERNVIKEIFREIIKEERINFYHSTIPLASKSETNEIEELYGDLDDYKKEDFVDMSDWVK